MKKSFVFASIACAGALALHADWTCQNLFVGIGENATSTNEMDTTNGSWNFSTVAAGEVSYAVATGLAFDLETDEHIDFTVGNEEPADTGTVTDVEVTGVFTPLSGTKPTDEEMNGRSAQVGFIVAIDDSGTNYCAWTGSGWTVLTNDNVSASANVYGETSLLVRFDYRGPTASFAIVSETPAITTNYLGNSAGVVYLPITSSAVTGTALANRKVNGVSCYGSGTIAKADGGVGLGVAAVGDVKYGSLADAIKGAAEGNTVTVLRTTTESVNAKDGVKISDPNRLAEGATISVPPNTTVGIVPTAAELNSGTSGDCTVPLQITAASVNQIDIDLGDVGNTKEVINKAIDTSVSPHTLTFTLQTKADIVTNLTPVAGGKALRHNEERLRSFLNTYVHDLYISSGSTSAALLTAIETPNSTSGRPLWQSYVLGVEPSASLAPVSAPADTSTTGITLALPVAIDPTGDYTVSYKLNGTVKEGATAGNIQIPIENSGTYTVTIGLD